MQITITVPKSDEKCLGDKKDKLERKVKAAVFDIVDSSRKQAFLEQNPIPKYTSLDKEDIEVNIV